MKMERFFADLCAMNGERISIVTPKQTWRVTAP